MSNQKFQACIDACLTSAIACNRCATECLNEDGVKTHIACIQLSRQCSVICFAAAQLLSIGGKHATHLCAECVEVCEACATECEKHSHSHCKECAESCRKCAEECRAMNKMAA